MREEIESALQAVAVDEDVRILFACESGSRAWGFASTDSDYDVRFLYARKRDWYLSIDSRRDVIEAMLPHEIDLAGWDLRKTLGLLRKSNPALLEWLRSPIIYAADDQFVGELQELSKGYYSLNRCFQHYLHMAEGNWRAYLQGEEITHKKYLYVLRPVLAARWIQTRQLAAPMEFHVLLDVLADERVRGAIDGLLEKKRSSQELGKGPRIRALHEYLEQELTSLAAITFPVEEPRPTEPLNEFFRKWIG